MQLSYGFYLNSKKKQNNANYVLLFLSRNRDKASFLGIMSLRFVQIS